MPSRRAGAVPPDQHRGSRGSRPEEGPFARTCGAALHAVQRNPKSRDVVLRLTFLLGVEEASGGASCKTHLHASCPAPQATAAPSGAPLPRTAFCSPAASSSTQSPVHTHIHLSSTTGKEPDAHPRGRAPSHGLCPGRLRFAMYFVFFFLPYIPILSPRLPVMHSGFPRTYSRASRERGYP